MGDIKYKATMTREQWRATFVRAETANPKHRSALKWLSALAAETFEVAEMNVNTAGGKLSTKRAFGEHAEEDVTLELSREAVLGIKYVSLQILQGGDGAAPASLFVRGQILDSLKRVGPGETLLRMVQKEAILPDSPDLDEDELDLEPKTEEAKK